MRIAQRQIIGMRFFLAAASIALGFVGVFFLAPERIGTQRAEASAGDTLALDDILNRDGMLNLNLGQSGSINLPAGFNLRSEFQNTLEWCHGTTGECLDEMVG